MPAGPDGKASGAPVQGGPGTLLPGGLSSVDTWVKVQRPRSGPGSGTRNSAQSWALKLGSAVPGL